MTNCLVNISPLIELYGELLDILSKPRSFDGSESLIELEEVRANAFGDARRTEILNVLVILERNWRIWIWGRTQWWLLRFQIPVTRNLMPLRRSNQLRQRRGVVVTFCKHEDEDHIEHLLVNQQP